MAETKPDIVIDNSIVAQFEEIRDTILRHRTNAIVKVNEEAIISNWIVGGIISHRLADGTWGSQIVTQLSEYLRAQDPTLRGYSRRNLYNMVMFYEAYSSAEFLQNISTLALPEFVQTVSAQTADNEIVQMPSAQLLNLLNLTTFSNHIAILSKCKIVEQWIFYILYANREHLNYKEMLRCITNDTFGSLMGDKKNMSTGLKTTYPQSPSIFKDRAFVDFLGLPQKHTEKQLHTGILEHIKQFVLELGKDFLFVDSEYPLQVGASTFKVDLLFFHRGLQCLVAIELKASGFKPEYVGQLEFYLEALDRDMKRSNENPSIGILLCQSADRNVVEYAMSRSLSPTMVAEYQRQLIPKETLRQSFNEFVKFINDTSSNSKK